MKILQFAMLSVLLALASESSISGLQEGQAIPESIIIQPRESDLFVKIRTDRSSYSPKDRLQIGIELSQAAYLYVYDINSQGKVTLLFPNGFSRNNFLKAGKHVLPPSPDYSFIVSRPLGAETLQALALVKPIPLLDLTPQKDMDVFVFPQLSTKPKELKPKVQELIQVTVEPGDWAADWTQFVVTEAVSMLSVTSNPAGAQIFVDGRFVGISPIQFSIASGRITITLVKDGYDTWTQQIETANRESKALSIELLPLAPSSPPEPDFPGDAIPIPVDLISSFQLGLDAGLSASGLVSTGFDLGFSSGIGIGASITFSEDDVPEFYDLGARAPFSHERVYNLGPELEAYLKLILPIRYPVYLQFGGGVAVQQQVHIAAPAIMSTARLQDVAVMPNGYIDGVSYLTAFGGIGLQLGNSILSVGHHTRRGWILGLTIRF